MARRLDWRRDDCHIFWYGEVVAGSLFGQRRCEFGLWCSQFAHNVVTVGLLLSQILLFGAEFTQVYAARAGRELKPSEYAVRVETKEIERR